MRLPAFWPPLRLAAGLGLALTLAGCSGEPDEAAIREGLEAMHREWAEQARRQQPPARLAEGQVVATIRPNLGVEARFDLQISDVRKLDCRPTPDTRLGYLCAAEVRASAAGQPPVKRRIEARFIQGPTNWIVRDFQAIDLSP